MKKIIITFCISVLVSMAAFAQKTAYAAKEYFPDMLWLEPYGLVSAGYNRLTFYYDENISSHEYTYVVDENDEVPSWLVAKDFFLNCVEFDKSFAEYRPKSTKKWFQGLRLWEIRGLEYLNTSQTEDMSYMFANFSFIAPMQVLPEYEPDEYAEYSGFEGADGMKDILGIIDFSSATNLEGMFSGFNCRALRLSEMNIPVDAKCNGFFENCKIKCLEISPEFNGLPDGILNGIGGENPCVVMAPEGFDFQTDTDVPVFSWLGGQFRGFQKEAYVLLEKKSKYSNYYYNYNDYLSSDSENEYCLTFFYDDQKYVRLFSSKALMDDTNNSPLDVEPRVVEENLMRAFPLNSGDENPAWLDFSYAGNVVYPYGITDETPTYHKTESSFNIVIDPSFADYKPASTYRWFDFGYYYVNKEEIYFTQKKEDLHSIKGLEFLNTEECTNMNQMFHECFYVDSLNLGNFTIQSSASTEAMLKRCSRLEWLKISSSCSLLAEDACVSVGTEESPCVLFAPEDVSMGAADGGKPFRWKGGWFVLELQPKDNINAKTAAPHNTTNGYYGINGSRLNSPTRGIVIRNGQKYVIK